VNDKGALPEIVHQTGGGLIYQDANELVGAMENLRTRPELRRSLGQRGFEGYMNHYTEEHHLQAYFDLIGELQNQRQLQEAG
jgi:glycosyltransferase involved in cell wall biosynthesis